MTNNNVQEVLSARREYFEAKREGRIERLENAAASAEKRSDAYYERTMQGLPEFGQPILIGHHSEKRHRRALEKSHDNMRRSVEETRKAEYYAEKAEAAKWNTAISSDDPDALPKLKEKLSSLQALQAHYKTVNKVVKSAKVAKMTEDSDKIEHVAAALGCSPQEAAEHLKGHGLAFQGAGYPSYTLTNNNANIKRVEQRVKKMEKAIAAIAVEGDANEIRIEELGVTVIRNHVVNRYQLNFDKRLTREGWNLLARQNAFKKTREGLFQRQLNTLGQYYMLEKKHGLYAALKALADAGSLFDS